MNMTLMQSISTNGSWSARLGGFAPISAHDGHVHTSTACVVAAQQKTLRDRIRAARSRDDVKDVIAFAECYLRNHPHGEYAKRVAHVPAAGQTRKLVTMLMHEIVVCGPYYRG